MSRDLVVALSGGIGGAKLALGLSRVLPADNLLVVANAAMTSSISACIFRRTPTP